MWKFAEQNGLFPFKTIGDVLEENQELKEEVRWLNDVITHNISEIMKQMDTLREKEEQQEQLNELQSEQIDSFRTDMDNMKDELFLDPVGN